MSDTSTSRHGEGGAPWRTLVRRLVIAFAFAAAFLAVTAARADGEAGIVIQNGDMVETYCVPFEGDSIRGDDALQAAGVDLVRSGAGGAAVCAINGVGCPDPRSFSSCFCQCSGSNCTYWAFFTKRYGQSNFAYSSLAFTLQIMRDGDLQAWKWGRGTLQSAPAPENVSFEQVCGHAPHGGTQALTPPPAATTVPPAPPATTAPPETRTSTPEEASPPPATVPGTRGQPADTPAPTSASSPLAGPSRTVLPPAAGDEAAAGGGSDSTGLIAFGLVAGALLVATAGAIVWRRRHGA